MSTADTASKALNNAAAPSAAPRSGARRYYRPELDAVRFLAFLLVFFHHILPDGSDSRVGGYSPLVRAIIDAIDKSGGYGLRLFFVLSAFLICELLLREKEATGTVRIGEFYLRRILRIWPLYYLGLVLGIGYTAAFGHNWSDLWAICWFAFFLGSWWDALRGDMGNPVNVLWSISVEEQFYLLAPGLIKFSSRRLLYIACGLIIALANLRLFTIAQGNPTDLRIWADPLIGFQPFAAGILVCLILHGRVPGFGWLKRSFLIFGAALCFFTATFGLHSRFRGLPYPGGWRIMAGYGLSDIGAVLILLGFLGIKAKLIPTPVIYLGRISYGLYVFHAFVGDLVGRSSIGPILARHITSYPLREAVSGGIGLVLKLGITIAIASLSYKYFESVFLRMKRRHSTIETDGAAIESDQAEISPTVANA